MKIASMFNSYYSSIADDILKKRKYEGRKSHKDYLLNPIANTFVVNRYTTERIKYGTDVIPNGYNSIVSQF